MSVSLQDENNVEITGCGIVSFNMEYTRGELGAEVVQPTRYDGIVILGRGIGKDASGKWKPQSYFVNESLHSAVFNSKVDPEQSTNEVLVGGANANNLAAFHLYKQLSEQGFPPQLVIFAAGRPDYLKEEKADLSEGSVLREGFLRKVAARRGLIEPETIILEKNKNTRDDIEESMRIMIERGLTNIAIITVGVHLDRSREFFNLAAQNIDLSHLHVDFLASEQILRSVSERYDKRLENVDATVAYNTTAFYEKRGIAALRSGTYDVRSSAHASDTKTKDK